MVETLTQNRLEAFIESLNKESWRTYKFSEIAFNIVEKVTPKESDLTHYIGLEHLDSGSIHIKRFGDPQSLDGDKLKIYKGDIIVGKRNAYLKRAAVAEVDAIASAHSFVLRANPEVILPDLFPFFMLAERFWETAIRISVGSLSPTINWKTLAVQKFLLPSKEQQAKLAELLCAADNTIEQYYALLSLQQITLAVYQKAVFNGNGIERKLKECAKFYTGSTPLRSEHDKYFKSGSIPWVKTLDLNNGPLNDTEEKITTRAIQETSCKIMPKEAVLVAMYGGFNQIGRTGILEIEAATNQAICSIICNKEVLLPEFLLYQLNARINYWKKVAASSRKDPNITKSDVEAFPIKVPEIDVQKNIVYKTSKMLEGITITKGVAENCKSIFSSFINQIFS